MRDRDNTDAVRDSGKVLAEGSSRGNWRFTDVQTEAHTLRASGAPSRSTNEVTFPTPQAERVTA